MSRTPRSRAAGRPWSRRDFLRTGSLAALAAGCGRWAGASPVRDFAQADSGSYDAVIVGGGIAGLTAAFYLSELKIRVLEKEAGAGGRVRPTAAGKGAVAQATYIGKPYGALKEIIEALGLEPWEIQAPLEAAFRDDQILYGPDGLARLLSERSKAGEFERFRTEVLAAAAEYQDIPELDFTTPTAKLDEMTARRWFEERKFPAVFAEYYNGTARGRFGASLDDVSALALIPEIAFGLGGGTGDAAVPGEGSGAFTFAGGLSAVTSALADWLADVFQPRAKVVRVSKADADFRVEYADSAGRIRSLRSKFVVLAIPAPEALAIDSGALDPEAKRLLESVSYASCAAVALAVKATVFGRAFQLSLYDGGLATGLRDTSRLLDVSSPTAPYASATRASGAARAGALVVQLAPARLGEAGWPGLADEDLAKAAVRAVSRVFPGLPSQLAGRQVVRFGRAFPVMAPGAFKRAARLNEISNGRVLLAGDHMIYPDFEAAADSGDFAAEKIRELI
ncbi:MAG: FAD-dependent oxidoreductase [Acidobacteriota bacterium]|nr:FAD-dependent oxidoreductase [Acidobacteriota bacterium]